MIILASILLWAVAGVALLLIMQYVMKTPHTPSRPELGLGRRVQIGPQEHTPRRRRPEPEVMDMAPPAEPPVRRRRRTTEQLQRTHQITEAAPSYGQPELQVVPEQPVQEIPAQAADEAVVVEIAGKSRNKKRTDTMQLMLNKAIAERR